MFNDLCISCRDFFKYFLQEHIYPHQPNRDFLFYPANDELNDLQGRRFLNLNNLRIPKGIKLY